MKALHMVAFLLVLVGALNWGLVLFKINLVTLIFGTMQGAVTAVYALIGASAVYVGATHRGDCKICSK